MATKESVEQNDKEVKQEEVQTENATETNENESAQESADKEAEGDSWELKYKELNDKHLRLYSEFENFRRRTAKEKLELIGSASGDLIKDVLPVIDDMERAIQSNKTSEDLDTVKQGFELVYNKLYKTLQSKGLEPADVVGETFDAEVHEAVAKIPAPEEGMKGKIIDVVEKGYSLNDKVIRYSKVVVGE